MFMHSFLGSIVWVADSMTFRPKLFLSDFLYQEAFLTTYRTFISAKDLIDKLLYRYGHFSRMADVKKKRLSRNAFALLIRVVDELW